MHKKSAPRLRLNRETLLRLESRELRTVAGGTDTYCNTDFSCGAKCTDYCTDRSICVISGCGCP
jgi:hypothetical protein